MRAEQRRRAKVNLELGRDGWPTKHDQNAAESVVEHRGDRSAVRVSGRALLASVEGDASADPLAVHP